MAWFLLFLVLASQDSGPPRPAPPPDPNAAMWDGILTGILLSIVLAPVLAPIAYGAGQRSADAVWKWSMSRIGDARRAKGE